MPFIIDYCIMCCKCVICILNMSIMYCKLLPFSLKKQKNVNHHFLLPLLLFYFALRGPSSCLTLIIRMAYYTWLYNEFFNDFLEGLTRTSYRSFSRLHDRF